VQMFDVSNSLRFAGQRSRPVSVNHDPEGTS
jgi:hypothetical protein